jgi:hypothetical protein
MNRIAAAKQVNDSRVRHFSRATDFSNAFQNVRWVRRRELRKYSPGGDDIFVPIFAGPTAPNRFRTSRSDPRTCWPARGRLSVGPTGPAVDRRGPLLGGAVSALFAAPTVLSTLCAIRNCHHEALPPGVT